VKLLLDAGVPRLTCDLLKQRGHDAIHANDICLGASDDQLVNLAIEQGRVIINLDVDFHSILAQRQTAAPSVICLRVQSLRHEEAADLIARILFQCRAELESGAVISANRIKIRVRRLPI
jgi:predicted nuclease of predicted toxin-antitoxin system